MFTEGHPLTLGVLFQLSDASYAQIAGAPLWSLSDLGRHLGPEISSVSAQAQSAPQRARVAPKQPAPPPYDLVWVSVPVKVNATYA